jgi:hypothetical protein
MTGRKHSHSSARAPAGPASAPDRSIAILGHELDNVLNGLLGMARLLRESDLSPEQDRWSRAIEQSGQQMRRLVSSFRSPALPPAARLEAARRLDGIDLLEQVVFSQLPLAAREGNRLLLTVDPGLPRFWNADPCSLRQLLDNLIGNANKFTSGGDILLHAGRLRPGGGQDGLALAVMDSGPGVDPGVATRIFEIGERGGATGCSQPGSGLGLYVCRQVAASMGGDIRLRPSPCGGAGFEVQLPGILAPACGQRAPPSRILDRVDCRLELDGVVRESVIGWLARLGVSWHDDVAAKRRRHRDQLALRISELQAEHRPGPLLLLEPQPGRGPAGQARRLEAPVVGSTLGPLLMEMGLEWLWLSRDSRD